MKYYEIHTNSDQEHRDKPHLFQFNRETKMITKCYLNCGNSPMTNNSKIMPFIPHEGCYCYCALHTERYSVELSISLLFVDTLKRKHFLSSAY